ncbi:MAG: FHA domain-containing protein [Methylococcales bacterium]
MAKFTVYFKNNLISSHLLDADRIHIGRDEANNLVINSPEFAPVHALIVTRGSRCMIKQLNVDFPLILNGENAKEENLRQGDAITAGKYTLVYSSEQPVQPTKSSGIAYTANYQIISGAGIGRIFQLESMTLLGEHGSGIVVISKRKEGYFASILDETGTITLNDQSLSNKIIKLENHDVLVVNNTTMQFYLHYS